MATKRGNTEDLHPSHHQQFPKTPVVQYGSVATGHMVLPTRTIIVPTVSLLTIGPPYGFPGDGPSPKIRTEMLQRRKEAAEVGPMDCVLAPTPGEILEIFVMDEFHQNIFEVHVLRYVGLVHCFRRGFRLETNSLNSVKVL